MKFLVLILILFLPFLVKAQNNDQYLGLPNNTVITRNNFQVNGKTYLGPVAFNSTIADTIVFMGTSITFGYTDTSITASDKWTSRATQMLAPYGNYREYNLGVPGTLLVTQIANIPHWSVGMAFLASEFGSNELNDALFDTAAYRATYIAYVDSALARGWVVGRMSIMSQQASQLNVCGTEAQQRGFNYVDSTVALQFGITYIDCYNPLLLQQYYYIWNSGVANIHPPVDAVPLLANIVGGAISKVLQYQNIGQQLLVQNIGQFGTLVNKNIQYIASPRYLAIDQYGNVGIGTQIAPDTRTQGVLLLGGGLKALGVAGSLQGTYFPSEWDSTKDWALPPGAKIVQGAQAAVPYGVDLILSDIAGNSYLTLNAPSTTYTVTAPSVAITGYPGGIALTGPVSLNAGGLNIQNSFIAGNYGGHQNYIVIAENGTYNMLYNATYTTANHIWSVSDGFDGNASQAMRMFADGGVTIEFKLTGDLAEELTSEFTVNSTVKGSIPFPRMTNTQRDAITSPTEGLHIYSLTDHTDEFWNGSAWKQVTTN